MREEKGFQLDYFDEREGKRCIVIQIINTSLSSVHRDVSIHYYEINILYFRYIIKLSFVNVRLS
jgi:hypothetical protein